MKKIKLSILLSALLCALFLSACSSADKAETAGSEMTAEETTEETTEATTEAQNVSSIENMEVEAICVDDSYIDSDESPLRMVYLFYTFTAGEENLKIDSVYMHMMINDTNDYESEFLSEGSALKYMPDYYYSGYIENVYTGTSLKVAATFRIPEADLAEGKTITFSDTQIPGVEEIKLSTDIIQHFGSAEEIAEAVDPEGYAEALNAYAEADAETVAKVKSYINGHYWQFYVNKISYYLEFWADNNFELKTGIGSDATGTYTVKNGYITITYPDTGYSVDIPYEFEEDGSVDLDTVTAFDVRKM